MRKNINALLRFLMLRKGQSNIEENNIEENDNETIEKKEYENPNDKDKENN